VQNYDGIGALGVIATLLYLGIQVRAGTRASEVESKLVSTRFNVDFLSLLVQSPELDELLVKGLKGVDPLSPEEYRRFSNMLFMAFSSFSATHFQVQRGALSESDWYENRATMDYLFRGPGCHVWWDKVGKYMYGPDYIEFIEKEVRNGSSD
jgi:hypothetical protein